VVERGRGYTAVDLAVLGVVAAIMGVIYNLISGPYYVVKGALGPLAAKMIFYGIWYMAAPLAASLVRKPLSAFTAELVAAFIEALTGGFFGPSAIVHGAGQGAASELGYAVFRYRKWGASQAALAGALAGPVSVLLDVLVWGSTYTQREYMIYTVVAIISGAIYGLIAYLVARSVKG
jgi:energy-coupling factor transport system substrate-specific component